MIFRIVTVNDDKNGEGKNNPEGNFRTPGYLFDRGMCLCDNCGKLHSIDYAFCNDCFREIFIDVDRKQKAPDEVIPEEVKRTRNQKRKK